MALAVEARAIKDQPALSGRPSSGVSTNNIGLPIHEKGRSSYWYYMPPLAWPMHAFYSCAFGQMVSQTSDTENRRGQATNYAREQGQ
jgi:hypothetical protein